MLSGASTFFVILTVNPSAMSGLNTLLLSLSQMIRVRKCNKADYVVATKIQVGDSWVAEDHLPPTVVMLWLMQLTTH